MPLPPSLTVALLVSLPSLALAGSPPVAAPLVVATPTAAPLDGEEEETVAEEASGVVTSLEGSFPGFTLFGPLNSHEVLLVDAAGEVVHRWRTEHPPAGGLYLLPSGHLLRGARVEDAPRFRGGGIGGLIQELDWDGEVVWEYRLATDERVLHHDLEPLPNGNLLAICWEHHTREEAVAAGRDPDAVGEDGLWSDAVIEIRPTRPSGGEIVWRWSSWDHLVQDRDRAKPGYGDVPAHPGRIDVNGDHRDRPPLTAEERRREEELERQMRALGYTGGDDDEPPSADELERKRRPDWLHTNSVAYCAEHDLVVLSTPHLCELWVIDHSTTTAEAASDRGGRRGRGGEILWRWGNPRVHGAGDDSDKKLFYQHDPTWLVREGELRLLVFNNGRGRAGEQSTVEELVLPFDPERGFARPAPGEPFAPEEPAWTASGFFSPFISGAQRLANGNTLVCSGVEGRLIELTPDRRVVWEYVNPHGDEPKPSEKAPTAPRTALFRATRIAFDHPALDDRK